MRLLLLLIIAAVCCSGVQSQQYQKLLPLIDKLESKCISWRHHLHQYPELGNHETKTAKLVADHLRSLGIAVQENIGKTGVVGLLKGGQPGPVIALRADMDGLPLAERGSLPYASKETTTYNDAEVGVMHACGHDTHVAILMTVAELLSSIKKDLKGTVKFIFQPAEEGPPKGEEGGAPLMIKEGVMENPRVDVIFGLHIWATLETGKIEYKPGAFMASADEFSIVVKGKGSHGSQPWLGIDPIVVSSQIINGLQTIVSRGSQLTKSPVIITVGSFHSGVRWNIIPELATMDGTIRTLDNTMQQQVHEKIKNTATHIAAASGATAEVSITTKTLVTYNDPALLQKMLPSLKAAAGNDNVNQREWVTGAEDFSYYATKAPALFFFLGGMPKGKDPSTVAPHHTPDFYVDDAGMKTGVKAFCKLVLDYMGLK